jgi:hypothetical protein
MLSGIQVKKMTTPRELYLECLDNNLRKTSIPRIGYKISMDSRTKAAQSTINAFSTSYVKPVSKNSHSPYTDSDSSSCEDQVVSLPSFSSLKVFINGLPHFEPLHFGFYLNDDKNPSCLCPCAKGVTRWRESQEIDLENEELCRFHLMSSASLLQHCAAKGDTYHNCIQYYLRELNIKSGKTWREESTSDRNRRGDDVTGSVDKNKSIFGFEIDRKGISGSVNGECRYLIFYF